MLVTSICLFWQVLEVRINVTDQAPVLTHYTETYTTAQSAGCTIS